LELVQKFNIPEYSQPAGGCCYLVDHNFAKRIKDLLENNQWQKPDNSELALLPIGRHFRYAPDFKIIVGRDEGENNYLNAFRKKYMTMEVRDYNTPLTILQGTPSEDHLRWAARVTISYSDAPDDRPVVVTIQPPDSASFEVEEKGMSKEEIAQWRIN
jgi:predicted ribosome quality control (RQC) complex YloA/Tae2 family protein